MHRTRGVGAGPVALSLLGYAVGAVAAYSGRSLTLTGLVVGVAAVAMSGRGRSVVIDALVCGAVDRRGDEDPDPSSRRSSFR